MLASSNLGENDAGTETQAAARLVARAIGNRQWAQRAYHPAHRTRPIGEPRNALTSVFKIDVSQLTVEKETDMQSIAVNAREAEEAIAFERVRKIKKFYLHVAQYVVVIAMLVVINLVTSPH